VHEALARIKFDRELALLSDVALKARNWTVNAAQFPVLDVTFNGTDPLRLRLTCDNWDEQPPSALLLNADGTDFCRISKTGIINCSAHPATGKYFICMRGFREYHIHSSHLTDTWETYRGQDGMNLVGLLAQVSGAWRAAMGV